jgi:hypothetical protein
MTSDSIVLAEFFCQSFSSARSRTRRSGKSGKRDGHSALPFSLPFSHYTRTRFRSCAERVTIKYNDGGEGGGGRLSLIASKTKPTMSRCFQLPLLAIARERRIAIQFAAKKAALIKLARFQLRSRIVREAYRSLLDAGQAVLPKLITQWTNRRFFYVSQLRK